VLKGVAGGGGVFEEVAESDAAVANSRILGLFQVDDGKVTQLSRQKYTSPTRFSHIGT
jgi:hypothetical protein